MATLDRNASTGKATESSKNLKKLHEFRVEFECLGIDAEEISKVLVAAKKLAEDNAPLHGLLDHVHTMSMLLDNRADCAEENFGNFLRTHNLAEVDHG